MQYVKLFEQFIFENEAPRKYGCAMVFFDFPEMKEIHKMIEKDDIYTDPKDPSFGLEKEPHATILFGLHKNVDPKDIKEIVQAAEFEEIVLHKVSAFENEKYDVLKFDVKCKTLNQLNKKLVEFPHTNKFPDYHPHCTIAYLKSGTAKKYIKMLKGKEYTITPKKGVYSMASGEKISFKVKTK